MPVVDTQWILPLLVAGALLAWLAWRAWQPAPNSGSQRRAAVSFRLLGILTLLWALLDPQRTAQRPASDANILAILVDNSESMTLIDRGESLSRGERVTEALAGANSAWIAELAETYQIRTYAFDNELRRVADPAQLSFDGARSDLATALRRLDARLSGMPLAGILLFSDGIATDAADPQQSLNDLPPIFPVKLGNARPLPDSAIAHASIAESPFDDAPLTLRAEIASTAQAGKALVVAVEPLGSNRRNNEDRGRLATKPQTPQSQRLRVSSDAFSRHVSFEWNPGASGIQFFQLSLLSTDQRNENVASEQSEATLRNNSRILMADRGKSSYRILYLSGRPNWEYKFLNRALADDPQLELVSLIRIASREPKFEFKGRAGESSNPLFRGFGREDETERYDQPVLVRLNTRDAEELREGFPRDAETLFAYDAIILDGVEADFFSYSQQSLMRDFVSQRGGGLLKLGGAGAYEDGLWQRSPLAQALPIYLDRVQDEPLSREFTWQLTRDGWVEPWTRLRSTESDERNRLNSMPPLRVANLLSYVKPGARSLVDLETTQGERYPGLVANRYGAGRVAALAVGDLWRWGMQGEAERADLARLWRQLGRWLVADTPQRVQASARLGADGALRIEANALDARYRPIEAGRATVQVRRIDNAESGFQAASFEMSAVPNQPGRFELEMPLSEAGAFHAAVEVADETGRPIGTAETGWVSEPQTAEYASLNPNSEYLESLATRSGGQTLSVGQLSQLGASLSLRPALVMENYRESLWHRGWLLVFALACFLAEWAMRRRKGLP